uniref:Protein FAR1-RELATED SEQUENCE n=1 Tax=Fagus sylvatica TaxID=28930 RepID=A0A2N9FI68_FAGSY
MTDNNLIMDHSSYNIHSWSSESDGEEIVSSESNGFETISESFVSINEGNREFKSLVPEIGMSFSCEQEAHKFYQKYATKMGFKVRKGKVQRLSNGSLRKRYFFCSQEGFRSKKQPTKKTTYTRKETRTGCNAKIQITFENESKHLRDKQMNSLQPEDAQGLIDCLKQLQVEDPSLFYTLQVDAESHMTNFFWRDSRSKIDYDYFGDVLILDTTFRMDRYNMICAPFLGVNHHQQPVLFGCAFLLDETMETYTWLLGTFMGAMGRRQPKTILTTECQAILKAVKVTLPKIEHHLCKPHVCQNAKQHLSMYYRQLGFESLFHSIQGSEKFSNANVFQNRKSEAMTLPEYVQKYEKAAEQQRREELHEDFCCNASEPKLILRSPMEKQAANIYTRTMFEIFQNELIRIMSVPLRRITKSGTTFTFKVTEGENIENIVEFNRLDSTVTCSCRMFESIGILCVHALKVLNTKNIFQIPPQYILKRWTKSAKDGVVEDDNCEEIGDKNDSSLSSSKRKLVHKALNFITKSFAGEKSLKIADHYLDIGIKKVEDVLKLGSECLDTKAPEIYVHKKSGVADPIKETYHDQEETSKRSMECQIQKKHKHN